MSLINVTEDFLRKLIDLAGNPHAKEELNADVTKLAKDAEATGADAVKDVQGSGS